MKAVGSALKAPFKLLGLVPNMPKAAPPPASATRDDARDAAAREDELRKRRGSGADVVTGTGGAEAGRTGKATLG